MGAEKHDKAEEEITRLEEAFFRWCGENNHALTLGGAGDIRALRDDLARASEAPRPKPHLSPLDKCGRRG